MPMKVGDVELLSLPEAAERLGLTHATLRWQVRNGALKAEKFAGRWAVRQEEVERYKRENRGNVGRPRTAAPAIPPATKDDAK